MTVATPTYELIFQGVKDSGGKTLQHLRSALVAELEYSVDDARKILASKQAVLKRSADQSDLTHMRGVLEKAGAMVSLQKVDESAIELIDPVQDNGILLDEESVAKKGEPDSLDPLEQISDLFRDLEEVCVTGVGEAVLNDLRNSNRERQNTDPHPVQAVPQPALKTKPAILKKKYWSRIVSLPEMIFSIGFSLLLALCSAFFYHL